MNLFSRALSRLKTDPSFGRIGRLLLAKLANRVSPETVALLDHPLHQRQRWSTEKPHKKLYDIINTNRDLYKSTLESFLSLTENYKSIPEEPGDTLNQNEPYWINGWMPALDGVSLYGFIVKTKPNLYLEVGSGNSTKFARKAILDHALGTKIISIDPAPRAEINNICDKIIRKPVEEVDLSVFDSLEANDILYIDNSHRVFMNSDVTTLFLDVLPGLKPGVLVQIHDVTLPFDYPADWVNRYYSEQYLLAAYILAGGGLFDIILPNNFISFDSELKGVLAPLWEEKGLANVETDGCSFWLRIK